jgi:uncharacterized protein
MALDNKEEKLIEFIRRFQSALVAFSGGLDSSVILREAIAALGKGRVWAVTAESPSLAAAEKEDVYHIAGEVGLDRNHLVIIRTGEIDNPGYARNTPNRCYFCKTELYGELKGLADRFGAQVIFDGYNLSDEGDFRPGQKAAVEFGVISPLREVGFTKEDIRELARKHGLSFAEKPAAACLASRIPYGTRVTAENLAQVDQAEAAVRELGFSGFRVRHHGEIGRLELRPEDIERAARGDMRNRLIDAVRSAGFKYVTVDLQGYRTGSMNEMISTEEKTDG